MEKPIEEPGLSRTPPASHAEEAVATVLAKDPEALARSYGPRGLTGILQSGFVARCAIFAAMGGFLFGTASHNPSPSVGPGIDTQLLQATIRASSRLC
jgi:hypothetical protein